MNVGDVIFINASNGFGITTVVSNDGSAIDTAGYFNALVNEMNVGDVIFINASNGFGIATVVSNDGSAIDVGDIVSMTSDSR